MKKLAAIDAMLERLGLDYLDCIRVLDRGESGRYFNIDYRTMGRWFMTLNE